jgi:hypothetical protein
MLALQPRQSLPGILKFGKAGVAVLPEVEEFLAVVYDFAFVALLFEYFAN